MASEAECGTVAGYRRHQNEGTPLCEYCRTAKREYNRAKYHGGRTTSAPRMGGYITENLVESYREQDRLHPGIALRTLAYRLIMLQRNITMEELAEELGVSEYHIRDTLHQGLRGVRAPVRQCDEGHSECIMDHLDQPRRLVKPRKDTGAKYFIPMRPWLDEVDAALTRITDRRGGLKVPTGAAKIFQDHLEAYNSGWTEETE